MEEHRRPKPKGACSSHAKVSKSLPVLRKRPVHTLVAQMEEYGATNAGVASSSLAGGTKQGSVGERLNQWLAKPPRPVKRLCTFESCRFRHHLAGVSKMV